ncbi:MAG: potassium-transporting ATPase subunit KdpC [Magnetococcales bacterium]|nr:potassium-transporting ATPase subunit KdpC [Magnetococcales bacterium]
MFKELKPALSMLLLMTVLTGGVYPALITGLAQAIFPAQANGSLLYLKEKPIGSTWVGQSFSQARYFWSRPSATSVVPYNAAASSGSNLGPLNPSLKEAIQGRMARLLEGSPQQSTPIPVDLVTSSASGLDPHISAAAAMWQVSRVARERHLPEERVRELVHRHTEGRTFGILGEARVHVLTLNLALDQEITP